MNPGCVPSALGATTPLPDTCAGVFVSGSTGNDTTGDGTRGAPYASLGKAVAESANVIYVCAEATADTATVTVPPGTSIFGAIDCATFRYAGATKSTLNPGTTIALVLAPGAGARIEDMHIESADGALPGESSIAVLANAATGAALTRVDVVAGDGVAGEAGVSLLADSALDGLPGNTGVNTPVGACNAQIHTGGPGGLRTCGGVIVDGGNGGSASTDPGGDGGDGQPTAAGLNGGNGADTSPVTPCVAGTQGAPGTAGPDGTRALGLGNLSALGYTGIDGTGASPGTPGQGGGGGGASACTSGNTGPSGGGGGSGACGGTGGGAGKAGGSSFGVVAFDATLTLAQVSITTGAGATGGNGGNGQPGGFGGQPGPFGGGGSCGGAAGGNGGPGGSGGGGHGGHSAGIASSASATVTLDGVTYTLGSLGTGGLGGDAKAALDGESGSSVEVLVL